MLFRSSIWNALDYRDFRYCHDTDVPPEGCAGCWRSFWVDVDQAGPAGGQD